MGATSRDEENVCFDASQVPLLKAEAGDASEYEDTRLGLGL